MDIKITISPGISINLSEKLISWNLDDLEARLAMYSPLVRGGVIGLIGVFITIFIAPASVVFFLVVGFLRSLRALRLKGVPGGRLRKWAEFFFSRKVYEQVFEPTLRDLLDEYCEALNAHRPWKARWIRIRGYWSFWSAVIAQTPISIVKKVYQIWKAIP